MRPALLIVAAIWLGAILPVHADPVIASVQQALKDQGFYYGEVTGNKDADTTAAIRRYQIRNGLKITGELNAETQKALGVHGNATSKAPAPAPSPSNRPAVPRESPTADTSDLRDDSPAAVRQPRVTAPPLQPNQPMPQPRSVPGPPDAYSAAGGVFDGTPYAMAPADVQRQVMISAQAMLARQGYYRGFVDGAYGPATDFAIRGFQARAGVPQTGRLDVPTLGRLGLLPGQRGPGSAAPRRIYRQPPVVPYPGERVYIPQ